MRGILSEGDRYQFTPVDRRAQERESEGRPLAQLLAEFAELRQANLAELAGLGLRPEDCARELRGFLAVQR